MSAKKVLFYSSEPGGAEILSSLMAMMDGTFVKEVYAKGYAKERFMQYSVESADVAIVNAGLVKKCAPDLIITSCCSYYWDDTNDRILWRLGREYSIPTVAVLDDWQNLLARFNSQENPERAINRPDFLVVPCLEIMNELRQLGFSEEQLLLMGNPAVSKQLMDISSVNAERIKRHLNIESHEEVKLYVSQPLCEHWPYDQESVLKFVLDHKGEGELIVKVHPKDDVQAIEEVIEEHAVEKVRVVQNELSPSEIIAVSDEIVGITSSMLTLGYMAGKQITSIQLHPEESKYELLLSSLNLINTIHTLDLKNSDHQVTKHGGLDMSFRRERFNQFIIDLTEAEV